MKIYSASYLSEPEVARRLGFEGATRTVDPFVPTISRYEAAAGTLELLFGGGADKPFEMISYTRAAPPVPITWASSTELRQRWQKAATQAAAIVGLLTDLTPVVYVGTGTDAELAGELDRGFPLFLLLDGRLVWIDDMQVQVDTTGVYALRAEEFPAGATPVGEIEARTHAEVDALVSQAAVVPLAIPGLAYPIFYGFDVDTTSLRPYFLLDRLDTISLDRAAPNPFAWP
jgi:hypothetical protein